MFLISLVLPFLIKLNIVSDKNAFRSVDSDLTTHSVILDSISRRFVVVLNLQNGFPAGSFPKKNWLHFFSAFFFL